MSGEEVLSLPVYLRWPNYDDEKDIQYFPFKSVIMILTFIMLLLSSFAAKAARLDHLLRYENYELHSEYGESPSKEELQPTPPGFFIIQYESYCIITSRIIYSKIFRKCCKNEYF